MSHSNRIKCSSCAKVTSVGIIGVNALPVNLTLVKFIHDCQEQRDFCYACHVTRAVKICYSCDPLGFRLCEECCTREHERDFPPVRAHNPMLIEVDGKINPRISCNTHDCLSLTHFSEKHRKFACKPHLDDQPDDVKADYEKIEVAVQKLKSDLSPVIDNLEGYLKRLQDAHHNISTIQSQFAMIGSKTIMAIQHRFTKFQDIFQERQEHLRKHADTCVSKVY